MLWWPCGLRHGSKAPASSRAHSLQCSPGDGHSCSVPVPPDRATSAWQGGERAAAGMPKGGHGAAGEGGSRGIVVPALPSCNGWSTKPPFKRTPIPSVSSGPQNLISGPCWFLKSPQVTGSPHRTSSVTVPLRIALHSPLLPAGPSGSCGPHRGHSPHSSSRCPFPPGLSVVRALGARCYSLPAPRGGQPRARPPPPATESMAPQCLSELGSLFLWLLLTSLKP